MKLSFDGRVRLATNSNQETFGQLLGPFSTGKLARLITGIAGRFDVGSGQSGLDNGGLGGDTSFAVSQHLALTGNFQHSARLHMDTMAVGVAFTFGIGSYKAPTQ